MTDQYQVQTTLETFFLVFKKAQAKKLYQTTPRSIDGDNFKIPISITMDKLVLPLYSEEIIKQKQYLLKNSAKLFLGNIQLVLPRFHNHILYLWLPTHNLLLKPDHGFLYKYPNLISKRYLRIQFRIYLFKSVMSSVLNVIIFKIFKN